MATFKLLLFPGDGIGPEVMAELEKIIDHFNSEGVAKFEIEKGLVGGGAYDKHGKAISDSDMDLAQGADAIFLAAVGGPKWDGVPYDVRPEAGLLRLRKELGLYTNLRPAICYPALASSSSLKAEVVEGLDIMIVRELTGESILASRSKSWILATVSGAPSTPKSTTPTKSSGSGALPSSSPATGAIRSLRPRSAM